MNKNKLIEIFTENLLELLNEKLTLIESLSVLAASKMTCSKIRNLSGYIADQLKEGVTFSMALKKYPLILFPSNFIAFISLSEKTGNLEQTLDYLLKKIKRNNENETALKNALIYPVFIVFLVIIIFIAFLVKGKIFLESEFLNGISEDMIVRNISFSFASFLLVAFGVIYSVWKVMGDNKYYEVFLASGFLTKSGMRMSEAVLVAAENTSLNRIGMEYFVSASEAIEYGKNLKNAFSTNRKSFFQNKIDIALVIAEETGRKDEVLFKIAETIRKEKDRYRKICLSLIEPAFITLTGVFLLKIVIDLILPVFTGIGNI